jgi:hypothetical protein
VLGFDGSFNNDSTALVAATIGEKPLIASVDVWERPQDASDDWTVPIADVEDAIRLACKRWTVREVLCDPYRWARTMQILAGEGIPIVAYPQSPERMVPATARFYEAVMNGGVAHDGDEVLARHIRSCATKMDGRGSRIVKVARGSQAKIDAAVAAVMAFDLAAFRRGNSGREWIESLAPPCRSCGLPMDQAGDECSRCTSGGPRPDRTQPAPTEPTPAAPAQPAGHWSPSPAQTKAEVPDQTRAAFDMLRQMGSPVR